MAILARKLYSMERPSGQVTKKFFTGDDLEADDEEDDDRDGLSAASSDVDDDDVASSVCVRVAFFSISSSDEMLRRLVVRSLLRWRAASFSSMISLRLRIRSFFFDAYRDDSALRSPAKRS